MLRYSVVKNTESAKIRSLGGLRGFIIPIRL